MSGLVIDDNFLEQLTEDQRRRLRAFATKACRDAFLGRFGSADEKRAYFAELGRRSGAARRARSHDGERADA